MKIRISEDPEMLEIYDLTRDRRIIWCIVHRDFVDNTVYDHLEDEGEAELKLDIDGIPQS